MDAYERLESRCTTLIKRFLDPLIAAEDEAVANNSPLPAPNFDDFAAFRLLAHAELEGYYESKALSAVEKLDADFKAGKVFTSGLVTLMFLHSWRSRCSPEWAQRGADGYDLSLDKSALSEFAQRSLGFCRQFIDANNGIKEASIHALSSMMGFFPDELDEVLVSELNQYGRKRGDVAHRSWTLDTRTFDSADLEKKRIVTILDLTKKFYETV